MVLPFPTSVMGHVTFLSLSFLSVKEDNLLDDCYIYIFKIYEKYLEYHVVFSRI